MRFAHIYQLIDRTGPHATENFVAGDATKELLHDMLKVLVVGAGGLGCELLKDLVLLGIMNIDVVDMDTIEVTNLNRQFLFRKSDVGKPKAEVAARFVNERVTGAKITPHFKKIQDMPADFYEQFHIIVLGLDSIEARRWMNDMICGFVKYDENGAVKIESSIPIIDGGTEGFKGHVRVIKPGISACFECTLDLFPPQENFPLCTLAEIPRTAAHCIEWARLIRWSQVYPGVDLDTDNSTHMQWLFESAQQRADQFGIQGVTYRYTQGVAKNIIPAIASTNAIVAAACANEVFKLATGIASNMDDYMLFMGSDGIYTNVHKPEKREDCLACGPTFTLSIPKNLKVSEFLTSLQENPKFQCKLPSIATADRFIFMRGALQSQLAPNLEKEIGDFLESGSFVSVTDPAFARALQICLKFH